MTGLLGRRPEDLDPMEVRHRHDLALAHLEHEAALCTVGPLLHRHRLLHLRRLLASWAE